MLAYMLTFFKVFIKLEEWVKNGDGSMEEWKNGDGSIIYK